MRASQASSEFERGNHSYLRLSLGQFFGQRSEALGCLGGADDDLDGVKRVSSPQGLPTLHSLAASWKEVE
jgi:hypothetical protein